jgi:hypothetical protein
MRTTDRCICSQYDFRSAEAAKGALQGLHLAGRDVRWSRPVYAENPS